MGAWWRRLQVSAPARQRRQVADQLYAALVDQARRPAFFETLGVPDTPAGRFEVIGLHAALLLRRLKAEGEAGKALGQELFDLMFADLDVNLRELGIGDLSVGKHVKRLAQNFYARIAVLDAGLGQPDLQAVAAMLRSNVYQGGDAPGDEQVAALARYLAALQVALAEQPGTALLAGEVVFVEPLTAAPPTCARTAGAGAGSLQDR